MPKPGIDPHYLLGALNSSLLDFCNKQIATQMRGGWYSFESRFIKNLPIYIPDEGEHEKYLKCTTIADYAKQIMALHKAGKTDDALFLEKKIDTLVEEVYLG